MWESLMPGLFFWGMCWILPASHWRCMPPSPVGVIYRRKCRLGREISMQEEMGSLTLTFLPDCWFKTNPWKALFATRKYCQFLPNHISLWCELPEFWWAAVENNAFILFTNKGFGILSDIRKWFAALATLHMTVSKIVLKFLQDGEAEWGV